MRTIVNGVTPMVILPINQRSHLLTILWGICPILKIWRMTNAAINWIHIFQCLNIGNNIRSKRKFTEKTHYDLFQFLKVS